MVDWDELSEQARQALTEIRLGKRAQVNGRPEPKLAEARRPRLSVKSGRALLQYQRELAQRQNR